jgi:hypothetical protein
MLICDYFLQGSLLRSVQPELMETLIQSSKDGDDSRLQALLSEVEDKAMQTEDEEVEELSDEEEVTHILYMTGFT